MEIKFEKTGEACGQITVSVNEADYEAKVTEKLKEIGKKHVIPGFRKGHISLPELRKRFGREVKSESINDVVISAVFDYIRDNNLKVLGQPLPAEATEIDLKQTEYTFKYDLALWPELNMVLDKTVTLPFYKIEVNQEMMDEQDKNLRERFGAQVPGEEVDAKAVVKGSIMELNEDGTVKTTEDAIQVVAGIVAPFLFKGKEEADKFLGKHVGDKIAFNPSKAADGQVAEIASMLNIDKEKAAEVKADFEFVISEIIVLKPAEHDQDFFDDVFGKDKVHNEEEYNEALRNMIAASLAPNSFQMFNRDAHDWLVKTYGDMKLDNGLLKRWILLQDKNATAEQLDQDFDKMLPGIKWEIISGEVAEKLGVKVEEADLLARASFIARQQMQQYGMYNMDEETVTDMGKRILADKNYRRHIAEEVEELKTFDALRNAITLDEKTVTLDEFRKLANPEAAQAEA
ncbi:MAG: trigger factor [Muribaculaceae bacterium]|nr:trigger factor [Muribaculaceae bacterium]MCI9054606.1 trigger factor [Muribaculaceae bacterium]